MWYASELNLEFSYFPQLWLLEWGCKGLKNVTKGLRDVKRGEINARKAGLSGAPNEDIAQNHLT